MVTVTDKALSALQEILNSKNADNETAIRLMASPEANQSLAMVLDKKGDTDEIIEGSQGTPVLFLDQSISKALSEAVLDYRDTGESSSFTILPKTTPDNTTK